MIYKVSAVKLLIESFCSKSSAPTADKQEFKLSTKPPLHGISASKEASKPPQIKLVKQAHFPRPKEKWAAEVPLSRGRSESEWQNCDDKTDIVVDPQSANECTVSKYLIFTTANQLIFGF